MALFYPIDQGLHTKCFKTYPLYEFIKRSNIKFLAEMKNKHLRYVFKNLFSKGNY